MFVLNNIKDLLDYKLVTLTVAEQNLIAEMTLGYALYETDTNKFYLQYNAYLYKTEEELLRDAQFLYSIYSLDYNIKEFFQWLFETKGFQFKPLYNAGFAKFYSKITLPNSTNIN